MLDFKKILPFGAVWEAFSQFVAKVTSHLFGGLWQSLRFYSSTYFVHFLSFLSATKPDTILRWPHISRCYRPLCCPYIILSLPVLSCVIKLGCLNSFVCCSDFSLSELGWCPGFTAIIQYWEDSLIDVRFVEVYDLKT